MVKNLEFVDQVTEKFEKHHELVLVRSGRFAHVYSTYALWEQLVVFRSGNSLSVLCILDILFCWNLQTVGITMSSPLPTFTLFFFFIPFCEVLRTENRILGFSLQIKSLVNLKRSSKNI